MLGTSIQVYGAVSTAKYGPTLNFTLDSEPATTFTIFQGLSYGWHTMIYESTGLAPTEHELVVKNIDTTYVWLDYFIYNPGGTFQSPDVGEMDGPRVADKPPVGTIVASVFGGVALLLLLGGLLYFQRRRRRALVDKEAKEFSSEPFTQQPNSATPLTSSQDLAAKGKKRTKGQQRVQTEAEPSVFSPISPTSEGDTSLGQSEWPSQSSGSDTRSNVPLVPIHQRRGQGLPTTSRNPREKPQGQGQVQVGPDYFSSRPTRRQPTPGNTDPTDTPWDHPISPPPAYHDYR
jgi:hypothetical protein